ncbi:MAG: efflux RND transporter periplasmic adaptor subunit [Bosea sp. (in: a-proteobacteria)]
MATQSPSTPVADGLRRTEIKAEPSGGMPPAIMAFLDVEDQTRMAATREALRFVMVNAPRRVVPFETAILLELGRLSGAKRQSWHATAASDVVSVDRDAGFLRAIEAATPEWDAVGKPAAQQMHLGVTGVLAEARLPFALFLPLADRDNHIVAVLACLKADAWQPQSLTLLSSLSDVFAHAWNALRSGPGRAGALAVRDKRRWLRALAAVAAIAALAALMLPVPMQVYAPAEVVAASPILVTAPLDGIIADIHVQPGTTVSAGTLLASFADTKLRNEADVAQRGRDLAEARLFRLTQSATANRRDVADLAAAQAELNVADAELTFAREMLARTRIEADKPGVVIFGAKSDWIGRPVQTGERIMEIVDPAMSELRIDVPLTDSMSLMPGSPVRLYLDGDPLLSIRASVQRTSFRAQLTSERQLAFRTFAAFPGGQEPLRIGLRGTARIAGPDVSLGFYLFRRPITALRQRIGF